MKTTVYNLMADREAFRIEKVKAPVLKTRKEKMTKEQCLFNDECPFYLRQVWTTANRILRKAYCYGDPSECEILTRYLRDHPIPENMLPVGTINRQEWNVDENKGEGFIRIGVLTKAQVDDVLARQKSGDKRLFGEIALALGYINDEALRLYVNTRLGCRFRLDCHFYNTEGKAFSKVHLKEYYCDQWSQKCAIYQQKVEGVSIPTTRLPTDILEEIREP